MVVPTLGYTRVMKKDTHLVLGMVLVAAAIVVIVRLPAQGGGSASPVEAGDPVQTVAVPFATLAQGSQSNILARTNYLITSSDELTELWKIIDAATPPPEIDFEKNAVIAVFAGQQPTAGYAIAVSKVVDSGSRTVSVTLTKPDNTCMVGQVLTAPYEVAVVPATTLPFAHEDASITTACTN